LELANSLEENIDFLADDGLQVDYSSPRKQGVQGTTTATM
jgi:hypothetical protein